MKKTRHTPEQIVRKLRQAEARLASRSFGAFGGVGHTRQVAETLWALSGAAQGRLSGRTKRYPAIKKAA
jgi:hypothetical protein